MNLSDLKVGKVYQIYAVVPDAPTDCYHGAARLRTISPDGYPPETLELELLDAPGEMGYFSADDVVSELQRPMKFVLELDLVQTRVIIAALDLYARVGMESPEAVAGVMRDLNMAGANDIETIILAGKYAALGHGGHGGRSIVSKQVPQACRIAYDIECAVRKVVAVSEGASPGNVWLDGPIFSTGCGEHPLAVVKQAIDL